MISLIVKVDNNNLIGDSQRNCMPWEGIELDEKLIQANHADMKHFITLRKWSNPETAPDIVIMGRKTRESIPIKFRPFHQNINYIISRNTNLDLWNTKWELVEIFTSVESCLAHISKHHPDRDIHIIGGGQIYQYVLEHDLVDRIEMTVLDHEFQWDVYFPELGSKRKEINRAQVNPNDNNKHAFVTYEKNPSTIS